jgi:hypothetical protein
VNGGVTVVGDEVPVGVGSSNGVPVSGGVVVVSVGGAGWLGSSSVGA